MRVMFVEAPFLTNGGRAEDATAYKDGVPVEDSPLEVPDRDMPKPCIVRKSTADDGLWEITFLVDGSDPKGPTEEPGTSLRQGDVSGMGRARILYRRPEVERLRVEREWAPIEGSR